MSDSLRASLGWILVNREGPRIQPGPRCYRRSWIRDGTLTGTALVEMGFADEARAFLRWYAPFQLPDGRVPCAVDRHGIDQAVEHDSHGQLVWGVVEVFRLTGDRDFLRELWPRVLAAVGAIEALRAQRTTDAYRGSAAFGLLPESISHEGYASHPVHSYWDDCFAVRALADAADAAAVLGDGGAAARIGALRDAMRADLRASVAPHHRRPRHRLRARIGGAGRLRSHLDGHRLRPLRRRRAAAAGGAGAHLRALLARARGAPSAARSRTRRTRRTRCAPPPP